MPLQSFEVSKQWKVLSFVKRCLSLVFHHSRKVTISAKFGFASFWNFKAFKILHLCQNMCLVSFSPNRQLIKWTKFVFFQVVEIWSFNALKTSYFCQMRCLSSFPPNGRLTKWAKFVFFKLLKIQSFEKLLLLSKNVCGQSSPRFCKRFSILEENYGADIIKEHLYVRLLLTSTAKTVVE